MGSANAPPDIRAAEPGDVAAICAFGAAHIPPHYAPLIGPHAAQAQVRDWWNEDRIAGAVSAERVVVADASGDLVGVAEWGPWDGDQVVWKLYVHPQHRGRGIGPRLLQGVIDRLQADTDRLLVEQFAANVRAGAFYEREGFRYLRTTPSGNGDPRLDQVWRLVYVTERPRP